MNENPQTGTCLECHCPIYKADRTRCKDWCNECQKNYEEENEPLFN